ncbi:MAG TPA: hypothetical protein VN213_06595, partial [Solirubrobacteraceae bacterium]|nr:hypothetical protein [Solirubrobacteraceae bacterium]
YLPSAPTTWQWATGISACQYVATEPFLGEITRATWESPSYVSSLYQRHVDGRIWRYDGSGRCTATACPGWTEIDRNPATRELTASGSTLFQRHADGRVWKYDGWGQCSGNACPGWTEIDRNPRTAAIVGTDPF